jgi:hypothetical protein
VDVVAETTDRADFLAAVLHIPYHEWDLPRGQLCTSKRALSAVDQVLDQVARPNSTIFVFTGSNTEDWGQTDLVIEHLRQKRSFVRGFSWNFGENVIKTINI